MLISMDAGIIAVTLH